MRAEHERWDGWGYPDGLKGEEIPLPSRIVYACDAYHAMISDRPYREAMGEEEAIREIEENAGTQFCPHTVRALLKVLASHGTGEEKATAILGVRLVAAEGRSDVAGSVGVPGGLGNSQHAGGADPPRLPEASGVTGGPEDIMDGQTDGEAYGEAYGEADGGRLEEALRQSEERYRLLVELSPDPIAVHSEGKFVYINAAGAELLGVCDPKDLIGRPVLDFVHPDYRKLVGERVRRIVEESTPTELVEEKLLRTDGQSVDVEITGIPIIYEGKPAAQIIARDITERKRAEEALRQSEERFRSLIEYASDVITVLELDGTIRYESPSIERLLGYAPEELVGSSAFDYVHDDDLGRVLEVFLEGIAERGGRAAG